MKILVFGSEYQGRYIEELKRVMSCLSGSGADVVVDSEFHRYLREHHVVPEGFGVADIEGGALDADVALSFGGDGTFLRTARKVALRGVPIMGINTGSLGYLADVSIADAEKAIGKCLAGECCIDSRTMLHVSTLDTEIDFPYALNEVAIQKSLTAQMLKMRTTLNGVYLTTYMGDGCTFADDASDSSKRRLPHRHHHVVEVRYILCESRRKQLHVAERVDHQPVPSPV